MGDDSDPCAEVCGRTWTSRSCSSAWARVTKLTLDRRGRQSSDRDQSFVPDSASKSRGVVGRRRLDQCLASASPAAIGGVEEPVISDRSSRGAAPCEAVGEKLRACRLGSSWQRCCRAQTAGLWWNTRHPGTRSWCA